MTKVGTVTLTGDPMPVAGYQYDGEDLADFELTMLGQINKIYQALLTEQGHPELNENSRIILRETIKRRIALDQRFANHDDATKLQPTKAKLSGNTDGFALTDAALSDGVDMNNPIAVRQKVSDVTWELGMEYGETHGSYP